MPSPSQDTTRGLHNLIAEIEWRLTGKNSAPRLDPDVTDFMTDGRTYVLVLFDGLGAAQLAHEAAGPLTTFHRANLKAPFPTTTSVSLATIATGLSPSRHGLVSHLMWLADAGRVVNTLKWVDLAGNTVAHDYASVLPRPNLWERLRGHGVEPITVQPAPFATSPLTRLLYRGARFEAAWDEQDLVEATLQLAAAPRRLIFTYFWPVDFAGHVHGLGSTEFADAMHRAVAIWERLVSRMPPEVSLLGTADHGLIEYAEEDKLLIREPQYRDLRFGGDPRGVQVWGDGGVVSELAAFVGGALVDPLPLLGPDPTPETRARVGDALILAPPGKVVLPPGFDKRLRAYHGGLEPAELEVPLLVG